MKGRFLHEIWPFSDYFFLGFYGNCVGFCSDYIIIISFIQLLCFYRRL